MIITFKERKELFKSECKVINLEFEYESCVYEAKRCLGNIKWAIITDLNEDELLKQYGDVIYECYFPYVLLNSNQGTTITDFHNLEAKYRMRILRADYILGIDDKLETLHSELCIDSDVLNEVVAKEDVRKLYEALSTLKERPRRRLKKYFFCNKNYTEIAMEEGVDRTSIEESIERALENIKKFFE